MPRYCCLWIPDFAAWAIQQSEPSLKGKPVVAYQGRQVIGVSTETRVAGVHPGWTLHRAQAQLQSQLPDAVYWPLHGPTIHAVWSATIAALLEFTPYLESQEPGLLLLDVRPPRSVLPLVREWQAQCGVADDRATAELAAFTTAPGTLRSVRSGQSAAFLRRVPLSTLACAGLCADTLERLHWFGWQSVGDLCHLTKRQLAAQFDQATLLYRYAQAEDRRPVGFHRQPPVINAAFTFETPVRELYEWQPVLQLLIEQSHAALLGTAFQEQGAQTISIQVSTGNSTHRGHHLLPFLTRDRRPLYEGAERLLIGLLNRGEPMIKLTVQLGSLRSLPPVQTCLFGRERPSISVAVRALEERFPGALRRIVMLDKNAYLPEVGFRLDPVTLDSCERNHPRRPLPRSERSKTRRRKGASLSSSASSTLELAL